MWREIKKWKFFILIHLTNDWLKEGYKNEEAVFCLFFLIFIFICLFIWLFQVWYSSSLQHIVVASCGIQFSDQDQTQGPLHCKPGVLTTGPPGKSQSDEIFLENLGIPCMSRVSQVAIMVKNAPANTGDVRIPDSIQGQENPLEEDMATHSSILAWRIPWILGLWQSTVHWLAKSQIRLKWLSMHACAKGALF